MRQKVMLAVLFTSIFPLHLYSSVISLGYLQILADSPTAGDQELTILNETGSNCSSSYQACSNLDFTNWTLTVNYSSTYYGVSGPVEPNPYIATSTGFGDITPNSTNNVLDLDLCGGINVNNGCTPTTTITSVHFFGVISPSSFCLYDAASGGCAVSSPTMFFANPQFDLVWNSNSSSTPYVDENSPYTTSPDITVTDQVSTSVPEPASWLLFVVFVPVLLITRRTK